MEREDPLWQPLRRTKKVEEGQCYTYTAQHHLERSHQAAATSTSGKS